MNFELNQFGVGRISKVMRRRFIVLMSALGALMAVTPASASSDGGCSATWKLVNPTLKECNNLPALGPGNDTRSNLLLLQFDRHGMPPERPVPPLVSATDPFVGRFRDLRERFFEIPEKDTAEYAEGEGSRCRSNESGASGFDAALDAASDLPADERTILRAARMRLTPTCTNNGNSTGSTLDDAVQNVRSAAGQAFATYLKGTVAFYDGRFDEAATAFASLKGNAQAWIADTAAYMVARVEVNRMQAGAFDQYGDFRGSANVDQQAATRAEESLNVYLQSYPKGQYAASARGLLRRVNWIAGRYDKLAAQYAELLAMPPASRGIGDDVLASEIDSKLLPQFKPQMTRDPTLLAVFDLMRLRADDKNALSRDELEAQRPAFADASPLFDYLLAVRAFYLDHDNATVLKLLPDATKRRDGDNLWFSRQFLRGLALEAAGDRNARGFWIELYPGARNSLQQSVIQLALAMHDERHGKLASVFAPGSLVKSATMREMLLADVADAALLRQQSRDVAVPESERKLALFTLLYKDVTRGYYNDFLSDLAAVPADATAENSAVSGAGGHPALSVFTQAKVGGDFACPALRVTAAALARNLNSLHDRLCLAEFVRINGMDGESVDIQPPKDQLGGTASLFPGKPYGRSATYQAVIADKGASAADRAFALFRAINCYAPAGNNQCGGTPVPKAQRSAWYNRLKQEFPTSRWAKELRYWW